MAKRKVDKGIDAKADCLEIAQKALNLFDQDELHQFMTNVFKVAADNKSAGKSGAIAIALKESKEAMLQALLGDCATKANNISKFDYNSSLITEKKIQNYSILRRSAKNKDHNVESAQRARGQQLKDYMFGALSREDIALLQNKDAQLDIANAYDGKRFSNLQSKAIADQIHGLQDLQKKILVESNAMPIEYLNEERIFGNTHDTSKILAGGRSLIDSAKAILQGSKYDTSTAKPRWIATIKKSIDIEKTFSKTKALRKDGSIDMAIVDQIIGKNFDSIAKGSSELYTRSLVANSREAVKKRARMFYIWKGMKEYMDYSKEYGSGDLFQDLMKDIDSTARRAGMADIMGDSPAGMFLDLSKVQSDTHKLNTSQNHRTQLLFNELSGIDSTAVNPSIANFGSSLRKLKSMKSLALLPIQSLSDIANGPAALFRHGFGALASAEHAFYNVKNLFNNPLMNSAERRHIAELFKTDLDGIIGYTGKYLDATNTGSMLDKMSNTFFKVNGTGAYDKGTKTGMLLMLGRQYGKASKKSYNKLNSQTQYQWEQHGLSAADWELLRTKTTKVDGRDHFSIDSVGMLSRKEVKSLWEQSDKSTPLAGYRNKLFRSVYSLFDTTVENAVGNPGAFERQIVKGESRPGTLWGEYVKSFFQFKTFAIGTMRRQYYEAYKDLNGAQAKLMYATMLMATSIPLSYASQWLAYAAKGLTMPDIADMSVGERIEFITGCLAPGMGMFLTVLDPHTQDTGILKKLLYGASVGELDNILSAVMQVATGEPMKALKSVGKALQGINPVASVPLIQPYMDKALGKNPYLQPGQEVRRGGIYPS